MQVVVAVARWCLGVVVLLLPMMMGLASSQQMALAAAAAQDTTSRPAKIVVRLPADATLTFDGERTRGSGPLRSFETTALKPGSKYFYNVSATWEPNNYTRITRTRKIYVFAGKTTEVDLRKEDPAHPDKVVVRYVPTPQGVVDAMLEMGRVGKDDVVYDLGCGDGRIPITAVSKKFGARRGVGIDIDPQRIRESKANARLNTVEKKVEFREGSVLDIKDLSQASVVTLYLGADLNRQLRPLLEKELKLGSRIVSHRFLIGDWKPDRTQTITVDGIQYQLHLWTIKGEKKKKKDGEDTPKKDKEDDKKKKDEG